MNLDNFFISICVNENDLMGIIDIDKVIIPCIYNDIFIYNFQKTGLFEVQNKNELWGVINIKNEIIIPFMYDYIDLKNLQDTDLIIVKDKNKLWGLINIKNEIILPCKYNHMYLSCIKKDWSIKIKKKNNTWGKLKTKVEDNYILIDKTVFNRQHKILLYNKKKIYAV